MASEIINETKPVKTDSAETSTNHKVVSGAKPKKRSLGFLLWGIGSVLEILPLAKTYLPEEGNSEAIRKDWEAIGSDLWVAINEIK